MRGENSVKYVLTLYDLARFSLRRIRVYCNWNKPVLYQQWHINNSKYLGRGLCVLYSAIKRSIVLKLILFFRNGNHSSNIHLYP